MPPQVVFGRVSVTTNAPVASACVAQNPLATWRKFAKHVRYADAESEYASPPPPRAKREVDNWYTYPFETSFASVQAKPLYPAADSYPALDVDNLFSMDSEYDWNAPAMKAESPAPYLNGWSSWESTSVSMNWSMPLDHNLATFMPTMPSSTSASLPSVSYTTQSLEERVFNITFNEMYPSLASGFPSTASSYFPSSNVSESSDFGYLNGF
ncbi:hypothetical protein CPB85DRAFT_1431211 [Mucidula mucida]|nr:hypothetical protein CPB85DRAFT_1431211 [Mucidula mucida]